MSALEQYLSPETVAQRLSLSVDTVYRLCRDEKISSYRVGRRRIIPESSIMEFLGHGKVVQLRRIK